MKVFRRAVFILFCAVFVIGIPRIIFYALGYNFKPGKEQGIVLSGLIFLSTTPPGAEIYVNGKRHHETAPSIVSNLSPGDYSIRLLLKDHFPWARNVPVEAGKATVLGNILLRPKKLVWKEHVAQSYEQLYPIPGTHDMVLWDGSGKVAAYDWILKKKHALFASPEIHWRAVEKLWVPSDGSAVIAAGEHDGRVRARWSKIMGNETWIPQPQDWRDFDVDDMKWDSRDERYVFGLKRGEVARIDLYQKTAKSFLSNVRGLTVDNRHVFYFSDDSFSSLDVTGKSPKAIWKDADGFLKGGGNIQITVVSPERAFFLTEQGRLVTNDPPRIIAEKNVRGIFYDKKNKKLLYWTGETLRAAEWTSSKPFDRDEVFEIKSTALLAGARDLQTAFWAHDGTHVVYQDQNKVFLLEFQSFGAPFIYELLEVKRGSRAFFSEDFGEIFYLDKKTGYLMSLELIPKWKVVEIPFAMIREKVAELEV